MMCLKMPVQVLRDDEPGPSTSLMDVADLSRSGKDWGLVRNGKKGGAVQARSKCTNWYHPFLWTLIDNVMWKNTWCATCTPTQTLLKDHQRCYPEMDWSFEMCMVRCYCEEYCVSTWPGREWSRWYPCEQPRNPWWDQNTTAGITHVMSGSQCTDCSIKNDCDHSNMSPRFAHQVQMLRGRNLFGVHWLVIDHHHSKNSFVHSWKVWLIGPLKKAPMSLPTCQWMPKIFAKKFSSGKYTWWNGNNIHPKVSWVFVI